MTSKKKISFGGFKCLNCGKFVADKKFIGTKYRNHCPDCLWSQHIMNSDCRGQMEPIGLTFKNEGFDKSGREKRGELMLIHQCQNCNQLSINRIAADDEPGMILKIFQDSFNLNQKILEELKSQAIMILTLKDKPEITVQLYGKII